MLGAVAGLVVLVEHVGALPVGVGAGVMAAGLVSMRVWRPVWFRRLVGGPVSAVWRSGWVYRRRWSTALETAGLTVASASSTVGTSSQVRYVPPLLRVRSTGFVDRVRVRMLPGQTVDDYAEQADRLAQTFGAQACRVRSVARRVHEVELWLLTRDPLTRVVDPFASTVADLAVGPRVALGEDGLPWRLRLIGSHLLVVGATGSGKGSVLWSLLLGLQPAIEARLVSVWAIDPKGGMELAFGAPLFDRFCHGDSSTGQGYESGFADLLEDAVEVMRSRQDRLRGITRLHQPSPEGPLVVVLVDELAALTGWVLDRTAKKRIETALGLLLSQGRAVGVVVVGAVQDPRKDVLPLRDLFPTRIALRLSEAEQVHLVLGPGARDRGAEADKIPDTLPGVGYVTVDGIAEPVRVRFSHVTDDLIADRLAPAPSEGPRLELLRSVEDAA
ncbi:S-DNA-T family DNA segregation ATPase FtsK/SpoIIIE [Friedmanniella endophytica]|uniref:S-DNA-T family DNA segregation ATPase FtsK/SpoIIIE n=1 Tax=Microlunatus kandeliicorticis TaxID=1759536 RepID=A0A7W3IRP5_9ACTN|nr:FtsK/SpoIIIE domain-containing protein [Microlunatus kandeliicorticis]MBA8794029.1 S-DNA-T family DNA segregation ATPase FtsK/SpoIIIE [Microlunatus kandeliicorticis]